MNGIIHGATHPNDNDVSKMPTEKEMITGMLHYIERIVSEIAKPQKLLYMAIDGCAPRAKLNQQRSRRFRAAKDMAEAKREARASGVEVNDAEVFDSNCITPGTEFMAKVSAHLRFFIRKKIKEDKIWQGIKVIFSGHEVPGEGEHKIMEYIRYTKSQPGYDPNTRHCMYGQDADLIMLSLATHEPHFTLLREQVKFMSRQSNSNTTITKETSETKWQLLHTTLLREYLGMELCLPGRDLERVIDDFVFMSFMVGNDFTPHTPSLDISEGAFDLLFKTYKTHTRYWGAGYMTNQGVIEDGDRLEVFLRDIGQHESQIFADRSKEEASFAKRKSRYSDYTGPSLKEVEAAAAVEEAEAQQSYEVAMAECRARGNKSTKGEDFTGELKVAGSAWSGAGDEFKPRYYFEKFGITDADEVVHTCVRQSFLEALVWCGQYYYNGCCSWKWFYPFHYAPMVSDLVDISATLDRIYPKFFDPKLGRDLSGAVRPFHQLASCLPPSSGGKFLPKCFKQLMQNQSSPIIDFYPLDFTVDMNGKRNPWEGVNLLPFIVNNRLIAAMEEFCGDDDMTEDERNRNSFGTDLIYEYDPSASETIPTTLKAAFPDIKCCNSKVEEYFLPPVPATGLAQGTLLPGVIVPHPGFPSFSILPLRGGLDHSKIQINCFGSPSRKETLVLHLDDDQAVQAQFGQNLTSQGIASQVLGQCVYINWPHLTEGLVVAVTDQDGEIRLTNQELQNLKTNRDGRSARVTGRRAEWTNNLRNDWQRATGTEQQLYLTGRGEPGTGGIDIGDIYIRLRVLPLQGMTRDRKTGSYLKFFGTVEADLPLQLVLKDCPAPDPRFFEQPAPLMENLFPINTKVIVSAGKFRGCHAEVIAHTKGRTLRVLATIPSPEPPFGHQIAAAIQDQYFPAALVAKQLNIPNDVLGMITSSLKVAPGRYDIGLNWKIGKEHQLLGYVRNKVNAPRSSGEAWKKGDSVRVIGSQAATGSDFGSQAGGWEYTQAAMHLIKAYQRKFPEMFTNLIAAGYEREYSCTKLLGPDGAKKIEEVRQWLAQLETHGLARVPILSQAMTKPAVRALEKAADLRAAQINSAPTEQRILDDLKPEQLYRADGIVQATEIRWETSNGVPRLGDRILALRSPTMPFGLRGTVSAFHADSKCVEVIFDEEFLGGTKLQGACSTRRGKLLPWGSVLQVNATEMLAASANAKKSGALATESSVKANAGSSHKKPSKQPIAGGGRAAPAAKAVVATAAAPPVHQPPAATVPDSTNEEEDVSR